jgi:hypothetical protein
MPTADELKAIQLVQSEHPDKYIHSFGLSGDRYDIAVYESEKDFNLDAEDNSNQRMIARRSIVKSDI